MTTKNLLSIVAQRTGISESEAQEWLNTTAELIAEHTEEGKSVQVVNFGSFEVREKKERLIVHPKTGVRSTIPAKRQLIFKQSPALKASINK